MSDDKISKIRARHERIETTDDGTPVELAIAWAHRDRGVLLAALDAATHNCDEARAEVAKMREVLREFQCSCIGDRCDDYGQPYKPLCERDKARKLVEREW